MMYGQHLGLPANTTTQLDQATGGVMDSTLSLGQQNFLTPFAQPLPQPALQPSQQQITPPESDLVVYHRDAGEKDDKGPVGKKHVMFTDVEK